MKQMNETAEIKETTEKKKTTTKKKTITNKTFAIKGTISGSAGWIGTVNDPDHAKCKPGTFFGHPQDYTTSDPHMIEALEKFSQLDLQQLPVVQAGDSRKVIGMFRRSDVQAVYNREILVSELKT